MGAEYPSGTIIVFCNDRSQKCVSFQYFLKTFRDEELAVFYRNLMESEGTLYYFITYARKYGVN
jgi:tRNA-(ms[2]io[6]A)-hydroxylase